MNIVSLDVLVIVVVVCVAVLLALFAHFYVAPRFLVKPVKAQPGDSVAR